MKTKFYLFSLIVGYRQHRFLAKRHRNIWCSLPSGYDNQHKSGSLVNGGVGIEGRDIIELSRFITADLKKIPSINGRPSLVNSSKYFINDSVSNRYKYLGMA